MKLYRILGTMASGAVVYVLAVACSGGGGGGGGAFFDAMSDVFGTGGGGGGGTGGWLADALGDPVSEAQAAPPEIKEAPCNVNLGNGSMGAEVFFPGRTVNELSRAAALIHYQSPQPTGYDFAKQGSFGVKDGSVLVYCYNTSSGSSYFADYVRVVLPSG